MGWALASASSLLQAAGVPTYKVIDLGSLGGGASAAYAINAKGQVVGYSFPPGNVFSHATLFSGTGKKNIDLMPDSGATNSAAGAISDSGVIVGYADNSQGETAGALFTGTTSIDLGGLPGGDGIGFANGVNDDEIVGYAPTSGAFINDAALFTGAGGGNNTNLGTLPDAGQYGSSAAAVNDSGVIVGSSYYTSTFPPLAHAVIFSGGGGVTDLGTLPGGGNSSATAISPSGLIVGSAIAADGSPHAVLFSGTGGGNIDLGTLGGAQSFAASVNDSGQVVGNSGLPGNQVAHGFIYTQLSGMVDLNSRIDPAAHCTIAAAVGINDLGQIAANGTDLNGARAFLLIPQGVAPEDYTALIPPPADTTLPQGYGEITMTVKSSGGAKLVGRLGDGTLIKITAKFLNGEISLDQKLYQGKGILSGTITFETEAGTDADGQLTWTKPKAAKGLYPAGFSTTVDFQGATFMAPALASGTYPFTLTGGGLAQPITHSLTVAANEAITVADPGADGLKIALDKTTGLFTGSFLMPMAKTRTKFTGLIQQKQSYGAGYFLGHAASGSAVLGAPP
jgi:probable HAF family extracellular repeat protein